MMKKIFFWRMLAILFVASLLGGGLNAYAEKQQDGVSENIRPWAEYSDDGTLTFRYGSKSSLVEGKEYALNTTETRPGWSNKAQQIKKVVFDPSFADARPTTGSCWFDGCYSLATIEGIENLNTSEMTNMYSMFYDCHKLKSLDLSNFNTEKVTTMNSMFYGCNILEKLDISSFNTSKVTNMRYMFRSCLNLKYIFVGKEFTTQNVTISDNMFYGCTSLPGFDANVTDKSKALYRAEGGYFDDKSIIRPWAELSDDGTLTFRYGIKLTLDADKEFALNTTETTPGWSAKNSQIKKVFFDSSFADARPTTGSSWFAGCNELATIEGIENLNTSEMTKMDNMFNGCVKLKSLDLSKFNTEKVTDMNGMFKDCRLVPSLDLSDFNARNVTDMKSMFQNCVALKQLVLSNFNTSSVTDMSFMFSGCGALEQLDLSSFNTSNVTNMTYLFDRCSALKELDLSSFNTSNVTNMAYMFIRCSALERLDLSSFNTSSVTYIINMFYGCSALKELDLSNFNTSNVTNMQSMFNGCSALKELDLSNFNTSNVVSMPMMFEGCSALEKLNLSSFNTYSVKAMDNMFYGCSALEKLDISSFNTSNVQRMMQMFYNCGKLKYIFVGDTFTTQKVFDSGDMFYGCTSLPGFDANARDKSKALYRAKGGYFDDKATIRPWAELADDGTFSFSYGYKPEFEDGKDFEVIKGNLPEWFSKRSDITKVVFDSSFAEVRPETGSNWFYGCQNLKSIEGIEYLNTSEMTDMTAMFRDCIGLTSLDLSGFNTEKVTTMYQMFTNCINLTSIDLSNFNTQNVTNMTFMFSGCNKLKSIDLSSFDTQNVEQMTGMFAVASAVKYIHISDKFVVKNTNVMSQNESTLFVCPQDQYDALKDSPLKSRIRPCFSINATAPFGTLCVPIGGKLTAGSFSGFDKLYQIKNADADKGTITMTEVTSIEPGVPYVYRRDQSDNDGIITFTPDNSLERVSEPSNDNSLLKGTFESIYAPLGSYILLTDGNFHPVAADNSNPVGAYRAYLDLSKTQSGSGTAALKTFRMVFSGSETTGIDSVNADQSHKTYYDLTGRKVNAPQKGNLYIVNGKKVLYN